MIPLFSWKRYYEISLLEILWNLFTFSTLFHFIYLSLSYYLFVNSLQRNHFNQSSNQFDWKPIVFECNVFFIFPTVTHCFSLILKSIFFSQSRLKKWRFLADLQIKIGLSDNKYSIILANSQSIRNTKVVQAAGCQTTNAAVNLLISSIVELFKYTSRGSKIRNVRWKKTHLSPSQNFQSVLRIHVLASVTQSVRTMIACRSRARYPLSQGEIRVFGDPTH